MLIVSKPFSSVDGIIKVSILTGLQLFSTGEEFHAKAPHCASVMPKKRLCSVVLYARGQRQQHNRGQRKLSGIPWTTRWSTLSHCGWCRSLPQTGDYCTGGPFLLLPPKMELMFCCHCHTTPKFFNFTGNNLLCSAPNTRDIKVSQLAYNITCIC